MLCILMLRVAETTAFGLEWVAEDEELCVRGGDGASMVDTRRRKCVFWSIRLFYNDCVFSSL